MENNNDLSRRRFLRNSLLAAGGVFIAPLIESCSDDDKTDNSGAPDGMKNEGFETGVASFDPTETGVIIWTRYSAGSDAEITWS